MKDDFFQVKSLALRVHHMVGESKNMSWKHIFKHLWIIYTLSPSQQKVLKRTNDKESTREASWSELFLAFAEGCEALILQIGISWSSRAILHRDQKWLFLVPVSPSVRFEGDENCVFLDGRFLTNFGRLPLRRCVSLRFHVLFLAPARPLISATLSWREPKKGFPYLSRRNTKLQSQQANGAKPNKGKNTSTIKWKLLKQNGS